MEITESYLLILFCFVTFVRVKESKPVQLIIDTDLGLDVDDVGAIAVANHLQDIGACRLLGVVHNTGFYYGIGGVDVINHYYGRSNLSTYKLGAYTGPWGSSSQSFTNQNKYTTKIVNDYPSPIENYDQVPSAVDAYTTMLQDADNNSVVIASIGELTNLRDIIKANRPLFVSKVHKIYYMDGPYNFGCGVSNGSGWSPYMGSTDGCDGAAQYVIDHVPSSIKQVFTLNGPNILTGSRFNGKDGCGQGPVKEAYQIYTNHGSRPSWDLICVYLAVMGDASLYSSVIAGTNSVDYYGNEAFDTSDTNHNQYHVWIDGQYNENVTRVLDDLLCAAPCLGRQESIGGCSTYQLHSMKRCSAGHGAQDLENPNGSSAGTMSLYNCQTLCDKTNECTGITVSNNETFAGYVNCYRRSSINLEQCDVNFAYDTYTKRSVKLIGL
eukprot:267503_1